MGALCEGVIRHTVHAHVTQHIPPSAPLGKNARFLGMSWFVCEAIGIRCVNTCKRHPCVSSPPPSRSMHKHYHNAHIIDSACQRYINAHRVFDQILVAIIVIIIHHHRHIGDNIVDGREDYLIWTGQPTEKQLKSIWN